MTIIKPTPGRIVWYHPGGSDAAMTQHDDSPLAAIVAYVFNERTVNLTVFDHSGSAWGIVSVPLIQDGDDIPPPELRWCEWMPHQKELAAMAKEVIERQKGEEVIG